MGVNIGDINIPFVSTFSVDKSSKPTEQIKHLGNVPPHVAEFQADVLKFIMDGTLFQASGDVRDVDQYAEDITALVERFGVYNYIDDYQGRSGWLIIDSGDSDKSADSVLIRNYSLGGRFMPKNRYQARMHTAPAILINDFSLTLGAGGCDNYVPIPIGATYSGGDGSTIARVGADGTTTLVLATTANDIKWDLAADEVDVGECKVWDDMNEVSESDWVRVFNPDHVFTGKIVVENGLIRIFLNNDSTAWDSGFDFKVYANSGWQNIADRDLAIGISYGSQVFTNMGTYSISPDEVVVRGINDTIETEFSMKKGQYILSIHGTELYSNKTMVCGFPSSNHELGFNESGVGDTLMAITLTSPLSNSNYIATWDKTGTLIALQIQTDIEEIRNVTSDVYFNDLDLIVGTKKHYGSFGAIPFTCANLLKECEAMTQGAGVAFYTGVDASPKTGNTGSILNAQNENIYYEFTGGTDLPLGTYKLFLRAKDSAQVADDISCLVRNTTDSTDVMAETKKTLTGSWAYYAFDVTIASDDDTDTIRVTLNKETATANTIDLDYVLWVPITLDSGNGPQDISHQAMVNQNLNRELIAR